MASMKSIYFSTINDCTTAVLEHWNRQSDVRNVAKAWASARTARGINKAIYVRFYGAGKSTVCRRYFGEDAMPKAPGLKCHFLWSLVRRSGGQFAITVGSPQFTVRRSFVP
jgi:hypothetical protein